MPDWLLPTVTGLSGVVLGGVILSIISQILADRSERRQMRRDVLRRLSAERFRLTKDYAAAREPVIEVLNEVVVAYLDDSKVIKALHKFNSNVEERGFCARDFPPLMRAMAKAADLPESQLDCDLIVRPFTPRRDGENGNPSGQ